MIIKSCHSPTFNYGEVQAAELKNDPASGGMGVVLKELKECRTALKMVMWQKMVGDFLKNYSQKRDDKTRKQDLKYF